MDFKKNKKLILLAAGTAAICVILLIFSSSLKKKRSATSQVQETTVQETAKDVNKNTSIDDFWELADKSNEIVGTTDTAVQTVKTEPAPEEEPLAEYGNYSTPSFVSSSGDTLIYENGIYKRVDWVKEPEPEPDTLVINGKRYVEIKELTRMEYR